MSGSSLPTTVDFTPTSGVPFQFQAVLDDNITYNVTITWNVYRAGGFGWYINVYQQNGQLVFSRALIASPPDYDISMTAGYFQTKILYLDGLNRFAIG